MTVDEMFNELDNKVRDTVIVTLKYKYDFEESYTIENHILEYDAFDDSYFWLNDWYEGQTDIEVLGYMPLGDVDTTKLSTCEDCISREAVIDAIAKIHPIDTEYDCTLYDKLDVRYVLMDLPSVTPQATVGHWIDIMVGDMPAQACDRCNTFYPLSYTGGGHRYCPNCGAKMAESESDD